MHSALIAYELRHALRWLLRHRGLSALSIATLALAIGVSSTIFSVVHAVVLRSLPFREPGRLGCVWATTPEHRQQRVSLPDALDLAERCTAFSAVAHYMTGTFEVSDEHLAEELPVASVSVGTMSILGMTLQTGRYFEAGDERYDTEQVVMISDALWERRFQRRPQAVGSSLNVRGTPRTIIGVLGEHQDLLPTVDGETRRFPVWTPFEPRTVPRRLGLVHVLARVRDQVTLAQAQVELDVVASQLAQEYPASNGDRRFRLVQLADQIFGSLRTGMLLLLGAIGLVTLIATSNVLNILLAGAIERQRATALRLAIGARRAAIGSRLLLEGLLLAVAGGATGLVVATWSLGALRALAPPGIPRIDEAGVDLATLVFAVLLTLLIGLVLGCASAFEVLRIRSAAVLDHRQWGPRGLGGRRASELLVVGQIGVAVLLLVGAGLMIRSFAALLAVDPGLAVDRVLTIRMRPGPAAEDADLERQLKERIEALPDVRAFGTIGYLPFGHPGWEISISSDGDGPHASSGTGHDAFVQIVSPGCFDALGIRLLEGRRFTFDDLSDGSRNAVVSESLASKFWPDQSPIGRELTPGIYAEPAPHRVVGVVTDTHQRSLDSSPAATLYIPGVRRGHFYTYAVVRVAGDPESVASAVRQIIHESAPSAAVLETTPLRNLVATSTARPRFLRWVLTVLSTLGLVLSIVGAYSVMAYTVAARTPELGIRSVLGATSGDILRAQLLRAGRLGLAGVGIGLLSALLLSQMLSGLLFRISPRDPWSLLASCGLMLAATLLACLPPALRAARVDPAIALRNE